MAVVPQAPRRARASKGALPAHWLAALGAPRPSRFETPASPLLNVGIGVSVVAVFLLEMATPLGVTPWVLYLVPLVLCMFVWRPYTPLLVGGACTGLIMLGFIVSDGSAAAQPWVAQVNRGFGLIAIWAAAIALRQLIAAKLERRAVEWRRAGETLLNARMRGEQTLQELGGETVDFLCEYTGAHAGVLYATGDDGALHRIAAYAGGPELAARERVGSGEGLVGQSFKEGRVLVVRDVPDGYLPISSGLGEASPRHLVLAPIRADSTVNAVVELGFFHPVEDLDLELLEAISQPVGVAMRSAQYRDRLEALLTETQAQAEELQRQQEELRATNDELQAQSRALNESQAHMEVQQTQLEETNTQLEEQTAALECQRDELARAQADLLDKAEELARANRYKSEFLANMSHELRTPLNSSLILAKLLADNKDGNLSPKQVKFANTIYAAGNDLLVLINDILDLSRIEAGRVELDVQAVSIPGELNALTRTFHPVANDRGLGFDVQVEPGAPETIETDQQRQQQILKNLLSNAFKYTERGEVSLRVLAAGADRVAFAVRDSGIGIAPDQQEIIFEAFRQADGSTHRRYGGTGLGLSISADLARLLGGSIEVNSTPGEGSTFTLVLPTRWSAAPGAQARPAGRAREPLARQEMHRAARQPAPARPQDRPAHEPAGKPAVRDDRDRIGVGERSILVIEDDPAFAGILYDLAQEMRFRCLVTDTGSEALDLARRHQPSAMLLDMNLPDQSGLAVLDQLKHDAATRHIPVHVISVDDYSHQALEMGAVGYAVKPVRREQLIDAFQRLEAQLQERPRRLLVVEDVEAQRESICQLLGGNDVRITAVGTAQEALQHLRESTFDCVVMDLGLPDLSGHELLEQMAQDEAVSFPPVIVYTGRELSTAEEQRLRRYSGSIVIKGARSPERLLDEVTLFLHRVEATLPSEHQRMLREVRNREAVFEGRRVLLAEDDVRNIFALSSVLEPKGVELEIARNGKEALEKLDASTHGGGNGIDLVLMDIMMPEMDGLTAIQEIRKRDRCKDLPIIAITAKAMSDDREKCLEAGANDYVAKPLDIDRLLSLMRVWMSRQG